MTAALVYCPIVSPLDTSWQSENILKDAKETQGYFSIENFNW